MLFSFEFILNVDAIALFVLLTPILRQLFMVSVLSMGQLATIVILACIPTVLIQVTRFVRE